MPADRPPGGIALGRLGSMLALVPASPLTRVEAVVNDYERAGVRADVDRSVSAGGIEVTSAAGKIIGPTLDDQTQSLAGVDDVRVLADAFDSMGVYAAAFSTDISRFMHTDAQLLSYRAVATGVGRGADGVFLAIAFTEPDTATATENARRLRSIVESGMSVAARRPWSDLLQVDRVEARGAVVVAMLPSRLSMLWLELERTPDSVLWWQSS